MQNINLRGLRECQTELENVKKQFKSIILSENDIYKNFMDTDIDKNLEKLFDKEVGDMLVHCSKIGQMSVTLLRIIEAYENAERCNCEMEWTYSMIMPAFRQNIMSLHLLGDYMEPFDIF